MSFELDPQLAKDSELVCDFEISQVRLILDCQYPWCLLVPRINDVTELSDLPYATYIQVCSESNQLSLAMQAVFTPDKMNIASIGNMVKQLHIHHVARYTDDVAWPKPVWGFAPMQAYSKNELQKRSQALIAQIQSQLKDIE
ncbi:HIT domain-containing protein [Glaciecola sp. 1036]|uniref:HIT domain-containing protein n=1 Tax=Alteromonadaceae TaxID=72275 RepID=UPI003D068275